MPGGSCLLARCGPLSFPCRYQPPTPEMGHAGSITYMTQILTRRAANLPSLPSGRSLSFAIRIAGRDRGSAPVREVEVRIILTDSGRRQRGALAGTGIHRQVSLRCRRLSCSSETAELHSAAGPWSAGEVVCRRPKRCTSSK